MNGGRGLFFDWWREKGVAIGVGRLARKPTTDVGFLRFCFASHLRSVMVFFCFPPDHGSRGAHHVDVPICTAHVNPKRFPDSGDLNGFPSPMTGSEIFFLVQISYVGSEGINISS